MFQISPLQKAAKAGGLLLALLLAVSALAWPARSQAEKADSRAAKRPVKVVAEEEFFKSTGAALAQEILSPEEYKALTKLVPEEFGNATARCHVHCVETPDAVVCTKHGCG